MAPRLGPGSGLVILRDVIVAVEREPLRGPRALGLVELAPPPEAPAAKVPTQAPEQRIAPPLTQERVCEWLETQPAQVRTACALRLAPELEALAHAAREAATEEGRAQGRQEVLASVRSSLGALASAVAASEQAFTRECGQLAEGCAEIVAEVFRKLAGAALVSREATLALVLEVVRRVKDERALTIRVSPHDLEFLRTREAAIQEALGARSFTLGADPRVTLGGCLVESSLGTLDGRLEIQLQELTETLRAAKASAGASG
jgi:flagellar biosynthesis/type III secretory pathway protein FliH